VLLALAAMALVATPTALWVLGHKQGIGPTVTEVLVDRPASGFWSTLAAGTAALARATLAYPMPFLALFLLTFGGALWRARSVGVPAAEGPGRARVTPGFLGSLITVVLALHWLLIPTLGAVAFTEHWMHPALMILPVFLFALVEHARPTPRALRTYLTLLALVVAIALGARTLHYVLGADYCQRCRDLAPFGAIADQLRSAGFARGTIVTDDAYIGGNLRIMFPASRVVDPDDPSSIWPLPTGHGQCLAVWQDAADAAADRQRLEAYLADQVRAAPGAIRLSGRVAAPMIGSTTKVYALEYELWPEGPGACR
jgi:hypothetical protein